MSFSPSYSYSYDVVEAGTDAVGQRFATAIIQKAARFLVMAEAPLGSWGEPSEFGTATVRPDYQIKELLYGLHGYENVPDLTLLVTVDDVIRAGLQLDPSGFPPARRVDVQRCIDAAIDWIRTDVFESWGVA